MPLPEFPMIPVSRNVGGMYLKMGPDSSTAAGEVPCCRTKLAA